MTNLHAALGALLTQGDFNPNETFSRARAIAIALLSLFLIFVSVVAVLGPGRKGNTRKSVDIGVSSFIALIPGAIGVLGIGVVFASEVLGYFVPFISER